MTEKERPAEVPAQTSDRPTITIGLPSGWARAALAATVAALCGWFIPVVVASLAFWVVADNPWLKEQTWNDTIGMGSGFWALSLGSPAAVGGVSPSLIPLLWTLAQVFIMRVFMGSLRNYSAASAWAGVPFFVGTAMILGGTMTTDTVWWRVALGALLVSLLAALWTVLAQSERYPAWMGRLVPLWGGIRLGAVGFLVLVLVSAAVTGISWWASREAVAEAAADLGAVGMSGVVLALLQAMYIPLIWAWSLAWILGPGFAGVGGEMITPATPGSVDLPLPVWQLIPSEATVIPVWPFILGGVVCGVAAWWVLRKRPIIDAGERLLAAVATVVLLVAAWIALSCGAIGTHQLSWLGPSVGPVVLRLVVLVVLPAVLTAALLHPATIAAVKAGIQRVVDASNRAVEERERTRSQAVLANADVQQPEKESATAESEVAVSTAPVESVVKSKSPTEGEGDADGR